MTTLCGFLTREAMLSILAVHARISVSSERFVRAGCVPNATECQYARSIAHIIAQTCTYRLITWPCWMLPPGRRNLYSKSVISSSISPAGACQYDRTTSIVCRTNSPLTWSRAVSGSRLLPVGEHSKTQCVISHGRRPASVVELKVTLSQVSTQQRNQQRITHRLIAKIIELV